MSHTRKIFYASTLFVASILCQNAYIVQASVFSQSREMVQETIKPQNLTNPDATSTLSGMESSARGNTSKQNWASSLVPDNFQELGVMEENSGYVTAPITEAPRARRELVTGTGPILGMTTTPLAPHLAQQAPQSLFAHYDAIALIKELIPDAVFRSQILPLVQTAFKAEPINQISQEDWRKIEKKILSLKQSHNVDFPALYLSYLEKKTIKESVSTMIDDMGNDMDKLGEDIGTQFQKFLDKNKDIFKFKTREATPETLDL